MLLDLTIWHSVPRTDRTLRKMYGLLKEIGARVLDAPAEYPYAPGYFAVYFTDPDGLKFEFAHVPRA
jgi:catechol 2,3-dioxygenase-like lactoylglutathione lyase family enzyme